MFPHLFSVTYWQPQSCFFMKSMLSASLRAQLSRIFMQEEACFKKRKKKKKRKKEKKYWQFRTFAPLTLNLGFPFQFTICLLSPRHFFFPHLAQYLKKHFKINFIESEVPYHKVHLFSVYNLMNFDQWIYLLDHCPS